MYGLSMAISIGKGQRPRENPTASRGGPKVKQHFGQPPIIAHDDAGKGGYPVAPAYRLIDSSLALRESALRATLGGTTFGEFSNDTCREPYKSAAR
jgi:hypothetical protein